MFRPLAVDFLAVEADSNLGFFARGSFVAALLIVGVLADVALLSSASIGGGQMYFVRVRGIFYNPAGILLLNL